MCNNNILAIKMYFNFEAFSNSQIYTFLKRFAIIYQFLAIIYWFSTYTDFFISESYGLVVGICALCYSILAVMFTSCFEEEMNIDAQSVQLCYLCLFVFTVCYSLKAFYLTFFPLSSLLETYGIVWYCIMIDGGAFICLLIQTVNLRILFKYSKRLESNSGFILRGTVVESNLGAPVTENSELLLTLVKESRTITEVESNTRNSTSTSDIITGKNPLITYVR